MSGPHENPHFALPGSGGPARGDGEENLAEATPARRARSAGSPPEGPAKDRNREGRVLSAAERELAQAIEAYQRSSGRMFPTWSEVLGILESLGYHKL